MPRFGIQENVVKRGVIRGWTKQQVARLRLFLYSVMGPALMLLGTVYSFTFTVKDCPLTPAEWARARHTLLEQYRRSGAVCWLWLTEWQRRGVPHMHGIVVFPFGSEVDELQLVRWWLGVAGKWRPLRKSQYVQQVYDVPGWLLYLGKHATRGVNHYQRRSVPEIWGAGTGRLWGSGGAWPLAMEVVEVATIEFHRYRRLVKRWLLGHARERYDASLGPWDSAHGGVEAVKRERAALRRVLYVEGMLRCPDQKLSRVRAIGEFIPEDVARRLLEACMIRRGSNVAG